MARYDFYRNAAGGGYLLDVQSDLLEGLSTRIIIPLMPPKIGSPIKPDLRHKWQRSCDGHPVYVSLLCLGIAGSRGKPSRHHDEIVSALDMLFQGF
ncbi:CcdB family protein [Mesorhizobium sp.]|uniref:CcdB family protein n=1 Tax=Mesorhizobium sp. TaxID=1871066 RepID=UPI000FE6EF1B|nr:CcdB family protein [Mesorhizobium sp.]RWO86948.1 MAG: plasmid maintenance protein CcdB [Mesorhizobium sp.]